VAIVTAENVFYEEPAAVSASKIALDRYRILRPHSVPAAQKRRRYAVCLGFEIARIVEIGNEPGLCWAPSQPFLSEPAGRRVVDRDEGPEKAEMVG